MKEIPIYKEKVLWACHKCGTEFIIQLEKDLEKRKPIIIKCLTCGEIIETPDFKSKVII